MTAQNEKPISTESQKTPIQKSEGLSPFFGISKYDVQRINDLSQEYERTKDAKIRERITAAKLDAIKNAVDAELENYVNGYGNSVAKIDRTALEKAYAAIAKDEPTAPILNEHLGYVLLSFLDNYKKFGTNVEGQRTAEKAETVAETKKNLSVLRKEVERFLASTGKENILGSGFAFDRGYARYESTDEMIARVAKESVAGKSEAKAAKTEKKEKRMTNVEKAALTHKYLTTEFINSIENTGMRAELQKIHDSKSADETVKLTTSLQGAIGMRKPDGAFGKESIRTMLELIGETEKSAVKPVAKAKTEKKETPRTASKDKAKDAKAENKNAPKPANNESKAEAVADKPATTKAISALKNSQYVAQSDLARLMPELTKAFNEHGETEHGKKVIAILSKPDDTVMRIREVQELMGYNVYGGFTKGAPLDGYMNHQDIKALITYLKTGDAKAAFKDAQVGAAEQNSKEFMQARNAYDEATKNASQKSNQPTKAAETKPAEKAKASKPEGDKKNMKLSNEDIKSLAMNINQTPVEQLGVLYGSTQLHLRNPETTGKARAVLEMQAKMIEARASAGNIRLS